MKRRGRGGVSSSTTTYFPSKRDIIYTNPLKGQEQNTRCQLHPGSQHIFFFLFPFLSVSLSLSMSVGLSFCLSFHLFLWAPITVDFMLGDARVCLLFKGRVSFSSLGFCSVWLAGSGVPLQFQRRLASPHRRYGQNTERGREGEKKNSKGGMGTTYRPGKGRIQDIKALGPGVQVKVVRSSVFFTQIPLAC